jgi:hypothetical protein
VSFEVNSIVFSIFLPFAEKVIVTILFASAFIVCATDLSCLVSLPTEDGGLYHIVADVFFTLEDGTL